MDRDCHTRTRAELNHILGNHKLWLDKYAVDLEHNEALAARGALRDPLRADLSEAKLPFANLAHADLRRADLTGAELTGADLSGADFAIADLADVHLGRADLTGANLAFADLTFAHLDGTHLTSAKLDYADLTSAFLSGADLTGADLTWADLTSAYLLGADLTDANLTRADLTGAHLILAQLIRADLNLSDLTGAEPEGADLTGADLSGADLTSANLDYADLSSSSLQETRLRDAALTGAQLWYADFEPKVPPPVASIARVDGLRTLRWSQSFNELEYRLEVTKARDANSRVALPPLPSLPQRWLLYLSWYREQSDQDRNTWGEAAKFLWSDFFDGLQPSRLKNNPSGAKDAVEVQHGAPGNQPSEIPTAAQNQYSLIDLRNALKKAGYTEAELEVNLAYKRHTQSTLGMILYDWTCEYGAAPLRPLIIALALAFLIIPLYWLGFRHRWFGSQLLLVEKQDGKDVETLVGDPLTRPRWKEPVVTERLLTRTRVQRLADRLSPAPVTQPAVFPTVLFPPRLHWEVSFLKEVIFFSLISIINLGFNGFDFGRWVRLLFFREYDLKARGWLRSASGLQSLIGLGLLALSLLSFFGHPFE